VRGAVLRQVGQPLEVREDLELRAPGPGEVLVALRASGVCHSDLSLQNGTLTAAVPVVLGHERRGGVTVVVGAGSMTDEVTFTAGELFSAERKLLGCLYGSADVRTDFGRLLRLWQAGRLDLAGLVSRRITLDEVNDAFAAMEAGEVARSVIQF
jgi:Zn-dependent alcohol dehydrogenase